MPDPAQTLVPGMPAPEVSLPRDGGAVFTLAEIDEPVVLFFYPKDDTSGCTKEAIGFSEALDDFLSLGVSVLGVSKDTVAKHEKFSAKHGLKTPLLSDETSDVCERFGVWVEKKMYGRTFMGIERSTFLIDANGMIAQVWRKVKVPGHVEAVLEAARNL